MSSQGSVASSPADRAISTARSVRTPPVVFIGHSTHFVVGPYRWRFLRNIVRIVKHAQHVLAPRAQRGSAGSSSGQRVARRAALAAGLAAGLVLVGAASASAQSGASVIADVQCDQAGNGVLDLTLVNEGAADAVFVVVGPTGSTGYTVAPRAAAAVTYTDLPDGPVALSASIDGADVPVSAAVACDAATGEPPVVEVLPAAAGRAAAALPSTGGSSSGLLIGGVLVAFGAAASLIARRRYS
jgi:LPXTG-motif cell wall-anchored protein